MDSAGAGNGVSPLGALSARQRVAATLPARVAASMGPTRRRIAVAPRVSAASCRRRLATMSAAAISPSTAAGPGAWSDSSIAHNNSSRRRAWTRSKRRVQPGRPSRSSAGA